MPSLRRFLLVASVPLVGLILASALTPRAETRTDAALKDLKVFAETLALVDRQYVEAVDFRQLERGAYQGLAERLDPWSSYHDPVQLGPLLARDRGGDVGLLFLKHPQQYVRIAVVLPGSPADGADILRGEFIETLDGLETKDLTLEEAQLMLAGPPGTVVKLGFFREADDEAGRVVELKREDLSALRSVVVRKKDGAASLRVTDTRADIAKIVAAQLKELEKASIHSLVLDLRSNIGGTPEDAAALASLFTGPGPMFQRVTRTGTKTIEGDEAKAWPSKLVVLTSRATLGEAELVAEAVHSRLGVPLVGQPTFGKSTQQDLVVLPDGTGLWMSIAEYRHVDGSALPVKGIEPDEKISSRKAEPILAESQEDGDEVPEPSPDASPAPSPVPAPAEPDHPAAQEPADEGGAAADDTDWQLDRAFEILAGSPLKKAA